MQNKPHVVFARTKTGHVTHVTNGGNRTACGLTEIWHRSERVDYFHMPMCKTCVDVVTGELDAVTDCVEVVYAACSFYGFRPTVRL